MSKHQLIIDHFSNCTTQLNSCRRYDNPHKSVSALASPSIGSSPLWTTRTKELELGTCNNRMCCLNKLQLARLKQENTKLVEERDFLQAILTDDRRKLQKRLQVMDAIASEVVERENELKSKESAYVTRYKALEEAELSNSDLKRQIPILQQEVLNKQQLLETLSLRQREYETQQQELLNKISILNINLNDLSKQEQERRENLSQLQSQELQHLRTITTLQDFIQTSQQHFTNLQIIEERLGEKCEMLDGIKETIFNKVDLQTSSQEQQYLRALGMSLNEEISKKRIESDHERVKQRFITDNYSSISPKDQRKFGSNFARIQSFYEK